MNISRIGVLALLLLAESLVPLPAQPTLTPPNFTVSLMTNAIFLSQSITSMAVDRFGNVYLLEEPPSPSAVGPVVHRVRPDGTIDFFHAVGFTNTGQLAYNPVDGLVYLVDDTGTPPVLNTNVWRIDPSGGATQMFSVPLSAAGFSIDVQGRMIFGGLGFSGQGLYRYNPSGPTLMFLGAGLGNNTVLQALPAGDVLIAQGNQVQRFVGSTSSLVPFFSAGPFMPNDIKTVTSLARNPHNELGEGVLIGVRDFVTVCFCGSGFSVSTNLTGGNQAPFANEPFSLPDRGFGLLAAGVQNDSYWLRVDGGSFFPVSPATGVLYRIQQTPAVNVSGSLFVNTSPGQVAMDLFGPVGAPFLWGVMLAPLPAGNSLFLPPFGVLELNILSPQYLPVIDGPGLFGPPDPLGHIPPGGHFSFSLAVPPLPVPLPLVSEALIQGLGQAPNGVFYISNLASFTLP